ncbi:MAG: hypothetical protein WBL56_19055, partial [Candidatus Acidiferrum sp.]
DGTVGRPGQVCLRFIIVLLFLAPSALAQQSQAPPPSTPPADSQTDKPKDGKDDQDKKTPNGQVGKTKLEKETGTVNDRIFEVMPNYGTVETAKTLPPLTSREKFQLATAGVFDWGSYPFNAGLAAISQAKDDPKSWGQGWGAYAKRYGSSFADNSIGTYMTTAIFPSLLHEDPRYYQMAKGSFVRRATHGFNRLFVTRTDSGHDQFNFSESLGNAAAAAISNIYHAPEDRTASRNATTFALLILYDGLDNELKEFWPDIRRKVFHKNEP